MTGKARTGLWVSIAAIAVCAAVIVAVCTTLLPKKQTNPIRHVVVEENPMQTVQGELDVRLTRERLQMRTLNDRGFATDWTDETPTDFTQSKENVFGIKSNMLVGPKCRFTAAMAVTNRKPYAFAYWLEIVSIGSGLLAEQLEFTVTIDGETCIQRTLDGGLTTDPLETVESGRTARFTVSLVYLDVADNNETKNMTLSFDMVVHARLA